MIIGIIRTIGLRIMGKIFGAWIDPAAGLSVLAVIAVAVVMGAIRLWPHNNGSEQTLARAVTQAVSERQEIQAEHDKQEVVDNDFVGGYLAQLAQWRAQAVAADSSRDAVVISADDSWLRAKRGSRAR